MNESTTATPPVVVRLRGVQRTFGPPGNETHSLRHVDLTIREGEFVAIVGPSGAGKSTLLNILGLLDRQSAGSFVLGTTDVGLLGERARNELRNRMIGFVFQDAHMLTLQTSAENTALPLKIRGVARADRTRTVEAALDRLGLAHRANEPAVNLSGGERQRTAMARALSAGPALLLADEPTGALDSENSSQVIAHLRDLHEQGMTIIVITHDDRVASAAERQLRLVDGVLHDDDTGTTAAEHGAGPAGHAGLDDGEQPSHGRRRRTIARLAEELFDAISSHTANAGRALLLLLAFMLAIAGLVAALGISQSASAQIADRLTTASLDEVVVQSADPRAYEQGFYSPGSAAGSGSTSLARQNAPPPPAGQVIRALPGVVEVGFAATVLAADAQIRLLPGQQGDWEFRGSVLIADAGYLAAQGALVAGGSAALLDNGWSGRVAFLGRDAAEDLGVGDYGPGSQIWVAGEPVDVVGIIRATGRAPSLANTVVLSPAAARTLTPEDARFLIRTEPGFPAAVAEAVPLALSPSDTQAIQVDTVADLRNLRVGVSSDLSVLVGAVSILLLVLACLTSAVAMYLSVQARTKEVALRRAVGASRASIWRLFAFEGLTIGLAGGLAGAAAGLCAVVVVSALNSWTPTLDSRVLLFGVLAGAFSGLISAAYPASVAARADPALAIRG